MSNQLSGGRAIGLVARREFMTQISKKSFVISNVIILVAIIGGIIAFSLFSGGDEDKSKIGLVGNQSLSATMVSIGDTLGNPVTVTEVSDDVTARDQVKDGDLDVAVIAGSGGGVTVVTKKEVATNLRAVIESSVAQQAQSNALSAAGIDPAQLAEATSTAVVTIDAIDPPDPEQGQRIAMSIAAVVLLYMQILLFGTYVAMGVVEEKSSRVVELLLSTLRPLQLLWGKVLGIGAVGLMQMAAYAVAGVATGLATGVLTVTGTAIGVLFGTLGWFILGFLFFAVLYAAAGSMVSRQEDVNATAMPLALLVMAMVSVAFVSVSNPEGTLSNVLSWIPPFSAILMPLRISAGVASPFQIVGTILLMLVVTAALSMIAAKIYQRSILRIGKVVSWKEAFGR
ncbi:ABC transporter permease [Rhodococcus sp. BH4]|uniref:ABC transporter permease n=1 Tax=Rhodococcus sp. BH4 TaxID=1807790 RepID=UPI0009C2AE18|nr:ABC transporter permease [Rhodococcus sp. BH4]ARE35640.1 ABC transporter permease [Rhodococcus sp. BH4]